MHISLTHQPPNHLGSSQSLSCTHLDSPSLQCTKIPATCSQPQAGNSASITQPHPVSRPSAGNATGHPPKSTSTSALSTSASSGPAAPGEQPANMPHHHQDMVTALIPLWGDMAGPSSSTPRTAPCLLQSRGLLLNKQQKTARRTKISPNNCKARDHHRGRPIIGTAGQGQSGHVPT